jgi:hypothetical protein
LPPPAALVELQARAVGEQVAPIALQASIAAVVHPRLQVAGREAVAAGRDGRSDEQEVGARDLLGEPGSSCELEAVLELVLPPLPELAGTDRGERMDGDLGVVEALRQLQRPAGPAHRLLRPRRGRTGRGEVRVGHGELASRRERLKEHDRLAGRLLGFRGAAGAPEDLRAPAERVALLQPLTELPSALERVLDRRDRRVVLVGQVARVGAALQQLRALGARQPIAEPEGPRVLRRRLAVGAERGRVGGGRGSEAQDRFGVAGGLGVVREPGQVGRAARWVGERRQRPAVQDQLAVRRHRFLDGESGELVPERNAR